MWGRVPVGHLNLQTTGLILDHATARPVENIGFACHITRTRGEIIFLP
jgi:hypothetical protein